MSRYPRLERYAARLPRGLASYPECVTKGSAFRLFFASHPLEGAALEGLPEELLALFRRPVGANEWIPEACMMGTILAIGDHGGMDDAALLRWIYDCNASLLANPVFKVLMAMASPGMLLNGAARRWASIHRGSSLDLAQLPAGVARTGADLVVRFPQDLFEELMLRGFGDGVKIALTMSRAKNLQLEVRDVTARSAVYRCTWD